MLVRLQLLLKVKKIYMGKLLIRENIAVLNLAILIPKCCAIFTLCVCNDNYDTAKVKNNNTIKRLKNITQQLIVVQKRQNLL